MDQATDQAKGYMSMAELSDKGEKLCNIVVHLL